MIRGLERSACCEENAHEVGMAVCCSAMKRRVARLRVNFHGTQEGKGLGGELELEAGGHNCQERAHS